MSKVQGDCEHDLYLTDFNRVSDDVTDMVHITCSAECSKCGATWYSDYSWDIQHEGTQDYEGDWIVTKCDNCGFCDDDNCHDFFEHNDEDFCDKECAIEIYGEDCRWCGDRVWELPDEYYPYCCDDCENDAKEEEE
tara:strand:+ start:167 stop:574 length:408 start_codon:yes stop_codon:yes gene_type:complete